MQKFINAVKPETCGMNDFTTEIIKKFGERRVKAYPLKKADDGSSRPSSSASKSSTIPNVNDEIQSQASADVLAETATTSSSAVDAEPSNHFIFGLTQSGFLIWCTHLVRDNIQGLWNGIFAAGYDLRFDRTWPANENSIEYFQYFSTQWSKEKDAALAGFIDSSAIALKISPDKINPHEIYFRESDLSSSSLKVLQGTGMKYIMQPGIATANECFRPILIRFKFCQPQRCALGISSAKNSNYTFFKRWAASKFLSLRRFT
jgi:hypothetical protein